MIETIFLLGIFAEIYGTTYGGPGFAYALENSPLPHDFGVISIARSTDPNTNGSQFFITEVPVPELTGKHTIFGQCDAHSILLAASIARVDRNGDDKPLTPVVIRKITIVHEGQPIPPDPFAAPVPAPATLPSGQPSSPERRPAASPQ